MQVSNGTAYLAVVRFLLSLEHGRKVDGFKLDALFAAGIGQVLTFFVRIGKRFVDRFHDFGQDRFDKVSGS